jgi:hypothetical protein
VTAIPERAVWLHTLYVSDEVRGITPIHELANVAELLHVRPTSKHSQVVNCRLRPMLGLIWREPGKALRQEPVQEVDRSHPPPPQELRWHSPLLEECPLHHYHGLVLPLYHPDLLRGVRCREVSDDPLVGHLELSSVVGPKHPQLAVTLILRRGLDALDGGSRI